MFDTQSLSAAWSAKPGPNAETRAKGFQAFQQLGLPTPRHEDWKYTSLAGLKALHPTEPSPRALVEPLPETLALTCTNGVWELKVVGTVPESSRSLSISNGTATPFITDPIDALNTAFLVGCPTIELPADCSATIHLAITTTGGSAFPRLKIRVGRGAKLTVLEEVRGVGAYLNNSLIEITLEEHAELHHVILLAESDGGYHLGSIHTDLSSHSRYHLKHIAIGGALTRTAVHARLGLSASIDVDGLALAAGQQLHDLHLHLDHAEPHTTSRQVLRGIADDSARIVFTGKVSVRHQAQKSDAAQSIRNLVLSEEAIINARPQLEILADDVKCSHGTTIGQLDVESLFYLQSRGIPIAEAKRILTEAFARDILQNFPIGEHRIEAEVQQWLSRMVPS